MPWVKSRRGKAGAAELFGVVGQFKIHDFQVHAIMAGGNQVVAELTIEATLGASATATRKCTSGPSTIRARSCACATTPARPAHRRSAEAAIVAAHWGQRSFLMH